MKSLDNINFIPPSLEKNRLKNKIKFYKAITLIMWLCCLLLFILYAFQSNKNKALGKIIEGNSAENKISVHETSDNKKALGITTLNKFLLNLQGNIPYKAMSINDRKVDMEIVVDSRSKYYEILDLIENKCEYKILSLSPPVSGDGLITFKILIEVT